MYVLHLLLHYDPHGSFTLTTRGVAVPFAALLGLNSEVLSEIKFLSVSLMETKKVFQNCFRFCSTTGGGAQNSSCYY